MQSILHTYLCPCTGAENCHQPTSLRPQTTHKKEITDDVTTDNWMPDAKPYDEMADLVRGERPNAIKVILHGYILVHLQ